MKPDPWFPLISNLNIYKVSYLPQNINVSLDVFNNYNLRMIKNIFNLIYYHFF
jgi:hypothetical protein